MFSEEAPSAILSRCVYIVFKNGSQVGHKLNVMFIHIVKSLIDRLFSQKFSHSLNCGHTIRLLKQELLLGLSCLRPIEF